jgi:peptide chain release factor 1
MTYSIDEHMLEEYRSRIAALSAPQTSSEWKQFNTLQPLAQLIAELDTNQRKLQEAEDILSRETDTELQQLAAEEIRLVTEKQEPLAEQINSEISKIQERALNQDDRNALLEIRAGAGGEEASLFAADLFRMYSHFAQTKGFSIDIMNQHISETGGLKELIALIEGENAFGLLKYESGVHRVQRVPVTENAGRIHTSTASVAVMPEAEELDLEIKPEDITLETFRASGAGGQHINKTDSAVRVTHHPTGITVSCQESRSQIKNRKSAMSLLRSRLYDHQLETQQNEMDSIRRSQIGGAKRAEKIRTYNFPQNRVTDHRIKKTWHNIEGILNGNIDEMIADLNAAYSQQK